MLRILLEGMLGGEEGLVRKEEDLRWKDGMLMSCVVCECIVLPCLVSLLLFWDTALERSTALDRR